MKRTVTLILGTLALTALGMSAPAIAGAQEEPMATAQRGPATGFSITGRLGMLNTAGSEGLIGGLGGPAPVTLGFDTGSLSIGIGPAFHNAAVKVDDFDATSIGLVGANVLATFVVAEAAGGDLQLYPLVGLGTAQVFTSEETNIDSSFFIQAQGGIGMRYFLTPNVAAHVEIGEGFSRLSVTDDFGTNVATTVLTTWGNLGLTIIFG